MKSHRHFSRIIFRFFLGGLLIVVLCIFSFGFWIFQIDREWSPLLETRLAERNSQGSIRVLAVDPKSGAEKWVGSLSFGRLEERKPLTLSDYPAFLIQSVLVLEDPRFLDHGGFDVWGILRATYVNLLSLRYSQGGSTLTQQLVKNVFLTSEKTIKRKITEIVLAALIEKRFTKDQILEAYLNEIYLGQIGNIEIHGVGRGSEYYFGKPPSDLELHEAALLAAMIAGPGVFSPWKNPEKTLARRNRVLKSLLEREFILPEEFDSFSVKDLPKSSPVVSSSRAPYLMDALRRFLLEERGEIQVVKGGFDVELALDLEAHEMAEKILLKWSQGVSPEHEALIVGADPQSCTVKIYVGGSRYGKTQLDRIQQSRRPIGSLVKPLLLTAALEKFTDLNLGTVIDDSPFEWVFDSGRGKWKPENYDKKFRGPVTVRHSLEESLNVPFVKIFQQHYPDGLLQDVFDPLRAMGLNIPSERALPSALLGAIEQSPWDVLVSYLKLTRRAMGIATDAADLACNLSFLSDNPSTHTNLDSSDSTGFGSTNARITIAALEGALRRGTSRALGSRLPLTQAWAGKTGSSSDLRDAWYVGISPNLVILTWTGRDDNGKTSFTGASGAMPLVSEIINFYSDSRTSAVWNWPKTETSVLRPLKIPGYCRPSETQEMLLRSVFPEPESLTPPPQPFEWDNKTFVWEILKQGQEPEFCKD